jgi:hypothetical protein
MEATKIVGGGSAGGALGAAAVYAASRFGAHLTSEDGALIASGAIGLGAFVIHNGIKGSLALLWRGSGDNFTWRPPTPPPNFTAPPETVENPPA